MRGKVGTGGGGMPAFAGRLSKEQIRDVAAFVAKNAGTIAHQFVVLETNLAPEAVPVVNFKADETAAGVSKVGDIKELKPGSTATASFDLARGRYVLICNVPTHYNGGMRAPFEVT